MQAPPRRALAPRRGSSHPAADTAFPVAGSRQLTLRSKREAASQRRPRSIPERWPTRPSPAGYASAATGGARADPTGAATAIAGSPVTRRRRDDRGCVPERVDAGSAALLVLRTGLQGHGSQQKHCRSQSHRDLSH
jgi:hypothetical protein